MSNALTLDAIKKMVKDAGKKAGSDRVYPKTAFLPEGNHKLRLIKSVDEQLYHTCYLYGYGRKAMLDPQDIPASELPEGFVHELKSLGEKIAEFGKRDAYKFKSKFNFIIPVYLIETDKPSDYWKPNNLYYIMGNNKLKTSYLKFIDAMATDSSEYLMTLLDPHSEGGVLTVSVTGGVGSDAGIAITPIVGRNFKIPALGEDYVPLSDLYPAKFNADLYKTHLEDFQKELAKLQAEAAAAGPAPAEGQAAAEPAQAAQAQPATTQAATAQTTQAPAQSAEPAQSQAAATPAADPQPAATASAPQINEDDPWAAFG